MCKSGVVCVCMHACEQVPVHVCVNGHEWVCVHCMREGRKEGKWRLYADMCVPVCVSVHIHECKG